MWLVPSQFVLSSKTAPIFVSVPVIEEPLEISGEVNLFDERHLLNLVYQYSSISKFINYPDDFLDPHEKLSTTIFVSE